LGELTGSVEEAWELLEGESATLEELAELVFGEFTPASAWASWLLLEDGLWFEGEPGAIRARAGEEVGAERERREAKAAEKAAWEGFLERLGKKSLIEEDLKQLGEVEQLALNRSERSRIFQALGKQERPETAHRFLLDVGYWQEEYNPHPSRLSLREGDPELEIPPLAEEERLDLTHLPAYAIDDEGSEDPDDAITLDGDRIWVHVADAAALIPPDSPLDLEARSRAANLYLPDRVVHMLPPAITHQLALGLQEVSPALSFGFRVDAQGEVQDLEVHRSLVRVSRHSYAEIDGRMAESPFAQLNQAAQRFRQRRLANGAAHLDLPEVRIRVKDGEIDIRPLERLESREMVTDLMLMVGEATAAYALQQDIPLPFATQPPPETPWRPGSMAENYAFRRLLKPSRQDTLEGPHSGLGLDRYVRTTSPLRRYFDLVVHQQLRAHLKGEAPLSVADISDRIAAAGMGGAMIRKGERLSNTHWKLLYLARNPDWQGSGVVVDVEEQRVTLLIPALGMETRMRFNKPPPLNAELPLALRDTDLTELAAWFRQR
jgi:exoribonuclease-2